MRTDIEWIKKIDSVNLSEKYREELNTRKPMVSEQTARDAYADMLPKNFWKDTKVGRFLSLRTRAGKAAAGIAATIGASMLPPPFGPIVGKITGLLIPTINTGGTMEILQGADWIEIILMILILGLGVAATFLKAKAKNLVLRIQAVVKELKVGKDLYDEFKSKESDGGKELTAAEYKQLAEHLGTIIKMLYEGNQEVAKDE